MIRIASFLLTVITIIDCAPSGPITFSTKIAEKCPIESVQNLDLLGVFKQCVYWNDYNSNLLTDADIKNIQCFIFYKAFTNNCQQLDASFFKSQNYSLINGCDAIFVKKLQQLFFKNITNTDCRKICLDPMERIVMPLCEMSAVLFHSTNELQNPHKVLPKTPQTDSQINKAEDGILTAIPAKPNTLVTNLNQVDKEPKQHPNQDVSAEVQVNKHSINSLTNKVLGPSILTPALDVPVSLTLSGQPASNNIRETATPDSLFLAPVSVALLNQTGSDNINKNDIISKAQPADSANNSPSVKVPFTATKKSNDMPKIKPVATVDETKNNSIEPSAQLNSNKHDVKVANTNVQASKPNVDELADKIPDPTIVDKGKEQIAVQDTNIANPRDEEADSIEEKPIDADIDENDEMNSDANNERAEKAPQIEQEQDYSIGKNFKPVTSNDFDEMDGDSYFFTYFMILCGIFIAGYVFYHNKQKVMALVLEGRRGRRHSRGRRPISSNYHKLDSNLEEAINSSCKKNTNNFIY